MFVGQKTSARWKIHGHPPFQKIKWIKFQPPRPTAIDFMWKCLFWHQIIGKFYCFTAPTRTLWGSSITDNFNWILTQKICSNPRNSSICVPENWCPSIDRNLSYMKLCSASSPSPITLLSISNLSLIKMQFGFIKMTVASGGAQDGDSTLMFIQDMTDLKIWKAIKLIDVLCFFLLDISGFALFSVEPK